MVKELLEKDLKDILKLLAKATEEAYIEFEQEIKKIGYNSLDDYEEYEENNDLDPKVEKIFLKIVEKVANSIKIPKRYCDVTEWVELDDIKPFIKLKNYNETYMEVILDEICSYFGCDSNK
jgi:putative transposon-encoded protein